MDEQEKTPEPDLFDREEQCLKAIRTVRKAVIMRIVVAGLLIFAVLSAPDRLYIWGLLAFVLVIDLAGTLPLIGEWKKQRVRLKELIAQEEE